MPRQGSIVLCNTGWLGRPAGVDSNGDGDEWIDVLLAQLPLDQCRHFVIPSSTSCTACLLRPVPFDVRLHIKRPLLSLSLYFSYVNWIPDDRSNPTTCYLMDTDTDWHTHGGVVKNPLVWHVAIQCLGSILRSVCTDRQRRTSVFTLALLDPSVVLISNGIFDWFFLFLFERHSTVSISLRLGCRTSCGGCIYTYRVPPTVRLQTAAGQTDIGAEGGK